MHHDDRHIKLSLFLTTESILAGFALGLILLGTIYIYFFLQQYQNSFYPGIKIDQIDVGGLTKQKVDQLLKDQLIDDSTQITLYANDQQISSSAAQLGIYRYPDKAIESAFKVGRQKSFIANFIDIFKLQFQPQSFQTELRYNQEKLMEMTEQLSSVVDDQGKEPSATLKISGNPDSLEIFPGKVGKEVDKDQTIGLIKSVPALTQTNFEAIITNTAWEINEAEQAQALTKAKKLVGQKLTLKKDYLKIPVSDQDLISLLTFPQGINSINADQLFTKWSEKINRPAQDASFKYDPETLKVSTFIPDQTGIEVNKQETLNQLSDLIEKITNQEVLTGEENKVNQEIELMTQDSQAQTPLSSTNDLGINTLIGFGESYYAHSIPSRIHNVKITTDKISNTIVAPGEEFSFNKTLGEVSSKTGYKPAYVIKDGMTVLGDGGGVCQVSSTLFRALLDAGLDITRRLPHSYRVSYYELNSDPGFDATVYSGNVDLRFINDSQHHILIHGEANSDDLYMKIEIYGSDDGRVSTISDYRKWDQRGPAATQYFDDPSLPLGQLKQIDWSASGIKAEFKWTVTDKDGAVLHQKTYYSNYQPWAAKYLRGTKQ